MDSEEKENYDETEFFKNRSKYRLYFSKRFRDKYTGDNKRYVHKITESENLEQFVKVKDEVVLSIKSGDRYQLKAILVENTRSILSLIVQNFTVATGKPHNEFFSFKGYEVESLYKFLKGIKEWPLSTPEIIKVDDREIDKMQLSKESALKLVEENKDVFFDLIKNNITSLDIITIGYRKKQLNRFDKLLNDEDYFNNEKLLLRGGDEAVWQKFFEENSWVLGYGLSYIFNTPLAGKKLEQVVSGYNFNQSGKRADALLKSRGLINSLCFGEIKTHKAKLLKASPYRPESWAISEELAGGIAQSHRTIQRSLQNIQTKINIKDEQDNLTGEQAFLYKPKSFLIIGSLNEFINEYGVNEVKYSSFEMYRRSLQSPDIITYDELFERAKFIVNQTT